MSTLTYSLNFFIIRRIFIFPGYKVALVFIQGYLHTKFRLNFFSCFCMINIQIYKFSHLLILVLLLFIMILPNHLTSAYIYSLFARNIYDFDLSKSFCFIAQSFFNFEP